MRKPVLLLGALRQLLSSKDTAGVVPEELLCKNAVKVVKILVLQGNERCLEYLRGDVQLWSSRWPEVNQILNEAGKKQKGSGVKCHESFNALEKAKRELEHPGWRQRFENDPLSDGVSRPVDYSSRHLDDVTHSIDYSNNEPPIERHSAGRMNHRVEYDNSHNEGRTKPRVEYDNSHNAPPTKQRFERGYSCVNATQDSSYAKTMMARSGSGDQQWSNAGSQTGLTIKIVPPANQSVPGSNTVQGPMIPGIRGALFSPIVAPPGGRLSPHRTGHGHGVTSPSMFQRVVTQPISEFTPRQSPNHGYITRAGCMTPSTRTMTTPTPRSMMYSTAMPPNRVITVQQQQQQSAINTVFSPSAPAPQQRVVVTRQVNSPQPSVRHNMKTTAALGNKVAPPQLSPTRTRPGTNNISINKNMQRVVTPQTAQHSIQRVAGGGTHASSQLAGGCTHVSSQLTLPLQSSTPAQSPTVIRRPNMNLGGPMMSPKSNALRSHAATTTHREMYKTQMDTR